MAKQAPSISVIICAYTDLRWDNLVASVASIQAQTAPAHEIIVVIDHNPDLFERARAALPGARVIANRGMRGLSGARNSGIAVAQGEILAFLDEDAVADPNWLAHLRTAYAHPQVAGVGGAIEPQWLGGQPAWFPAEFHWVVGCTYRGMPETTAPVRNLIGCNMSFRREFFDSVGGFRDGIGRVGTLPVGCEETEFCIRVQQAHPHTHFHYEPKARVLHCVPATRAQWGYFRSRCYAEGLSKALVTRCVGRQDGLASERAYTLRTLPQGVLRGLADALRGDPSGVGRAVAIVAGLAITTAGYLVGTLRARGATVGDSVAAPVGS